MRHRTRTRSLASLAGKSYFWLITWHEAEDFSSPLVTVPCWMYDDLGRERINPLMSFDVVMHREAMSIEANDGYFRYVGDVAIDASQLVYQYDALASVQDLQAWATKGLARSKGIVPYIDTAREIVELRDLNRLCTGIAGLVDYIKSTVSGKSQGLEVLRGLLNQAGDQTLAVMFGVMPLAESASKVFSAPVEIRRRLRRLKSLDGKWRHRRVDLLDSKDVSSDTMSDPVWPLATFVSAVVSNTGTKTVTTTDKIWYETDVKFQIPDLPNMTKEDWLKTRLLGQRITPETLWELSPFSWLIDWFVDVRSFYSTLNDLTVYSWRKSCIMHETKVDVNIQAQLVYKTLAGNQTAYVPATSRAKVMRRHAHISNRIGLTPTGLDSAYRQVVTGALLLKSV